jgi:hypothetical protein
MKDELDHIFKDEQFMKSDFGSFHNLTILGIEDSEECDQVQNAILTDHNIAFHVMNCKICISDGLNRCTILKSLRGVYA